MSALLVIVGPTAVGKSALALEVAERLRGEIVNGDALQVYRGFDIGTAKPSTEERLRVPHHLIDTLDPAERYSAGRFAEHAAATIAEITGRGRLAIVVGGSGLYVRALLEGIAPIPAADPEVRRQLLDRLDREGLARLRDELAALDRETAERVGAGDRQRILRALEIALSTGRPLSKWIADRPFGSRRRSAQRVGLTLSRTLLYHRIAVRVGRMRDAGLLEEVRRLLESGVPLEAPAFQAIGYRQFAQAAVGAWSLERAVEETIAATRRFAKRQQTWFRAERDIVWFDADAPVSKLADGVVTHLRRTGLRRER